MSQAYGFSLYGDDFKQTNLFDDDEDGVINIRDKCAGTPVGSQVDNYGCPNTQTALLSVELQILFDTGKSIVQPRFYKEVKKLADFLKENPKSRVVIEGHTDDRGSNESNKTLSQSRASAIAKVLIDSFKIDASRVEAIGHGEDKPIADNETEEGRAENRRVVAEVFAKKSTATQRWDIYSVDK